MMVAAAASMFAACDETPIDPVTPEEDETPKDEVVELNQNLEFTLEVTTLEADNAKVSVSNNGTTADTWYGFVTSEVSKTEASLIEAEVATLTAGGGKITGLKKQTSTTLTVRGLEPDTDYKYIVFGLSENGEVYGKSKSVSFKTLKGEVEYTVNPAWTVTYIGDYVEQGYAYSNVVAVESTDNNTYFTTAWPKDIFVENGIKTIVEEELAAWAEYLPELNATWKDLLANSSSMSTVNIDTRYGSEWYVIAIGADLEGNPTGLYAMSELVTIEEEDMTEGYASWLGDWTFTGANNISFDVTFSKNKANQSYYMTGWEDLTDIPVTVTWLEEDSIWAIEGQVIAENVQLTNTVSGSIYFLPYDSQSLYDSVACYGGMLEDGTRMAIAPEAEDEDGQPIVMEGMGFYAIGNDNNIYVISEAMYSGQMPTFPITITSAQTKSMTSVPSFVKKHKGMMPEAMKANAKFSNAYMIR